MAAPTLAVWLQSHPFDNPETTEPPDVEAAYHLNAGENVLADCEILDSDGDPIPEENVKSVILALRRNEVDVISWTWTRDDDDSSPQIDIADGHIYLEISKTDTAELAGLYDFYGKFEIDNNGFFFSNGQTDVRELRAALFFQAAIVNPE
jgi:hypothetical protein